MKKFLKWFFGILFLIIILVVGSFFALPYIVDLNKYKPEIIAQIKPYMKGRDLKIPGDIKISTYPWIGFDIGEMVIGNAEGFVVKPFATIKQFRAHVKLVPLLFKEIEIDTIDINGLNVNLQSDAEGRNNWSDLAAVQQQSGFIKVAAPAAVPSSTPMVMPQLKVKAIHFGNGRIDYNDAKSKTDIIISKLNIDAGPINLLSPVPLKAQFNYHSKSQGIAAASAMAMTVALNPIDKIVQLDSFVINTNVSGEAVSNKTVATSLKVPSLIVDLGKEKVEARPFHLKLDQYQSEGRFKLTNFKKPVIRFGLEMAELDIDKIVPPAPDKATAPVPVPVAPEGSGSETVLAPLVAFKDSDMQGTITIKKLLARKLEMQDFKVNVLARGGLVSALPEAKMYGGSYEGDVQVTVRKFPISLRTKHKITDVSFGPIVEALTGKPTVTGSAKIQAQYSTEGNTTDEIMQNLQGDTQFNIRNAEVNLVDVEKLVLGKYFEKLKLDKKQDPEKEVTAFDSIRGTIRVKGGVAYNKDLSATSKRVNIKGNGHVILFRKEIDYTLYTMFKKSLSVAGYELQNKQIPTHISGTFDNLQIDNDLEEVIKADFVDSKVNRKKQQIEEKVKTSLDKKKDKLKEKLEDKLDLDRFLKR